MSEILRLYEASQTQEMTVYNEWDMGFHCILKSCYFPIILHWFSLLNSHNDYVFEKRFRILQTEYFVEHQAETIHQLLCWINGGMEYEYNASKCRQNEAGIPKRHAKYKKNIKRASWSPKGIDVKQLNISNALTVFMEIAIKDCIIFWKCIPHLCWVRGHLFNLHCLRKLMND
eukprot:1144768_1